MVKNDNFINVVSGLPRSGTSMMMKMLEAGGLKVVTDEIRKADEDNPRGYYEFEKVKKIKEDSSWLEDIKGKVVKMVSMLLYDLPSSQTYRIILMRREMEEILSSQTKMLERQGKEKVNLTDEEMGIRLKNHVDEITNWLDRQDNIELLSINYNDMIKDPVSNAKIVNQFIGNNLDEEKMVGVVDKSLYRNRALEFPQKNRTHS